ncbi:MAG: hypothetical protein PHC61_02805 [Chitinivibrionales bacterium]|nr:hypothetical protein [Chitinivibrionales bacterium]
MNNYLIKNCKENTILHVGIIFVLALISRIWYLTTPFGRIGDADEAVFGLMAQNILALKDFPIFCWEAHYAGTPVCYIAAIIFKFFGAGFTQLRCAMFFFYLPIPILFYFIYRKISGNFDAFLGALFLIFCPFLVLSYTMASIGGYGETIVGSALIILVSWHIYEKGETVRNRVFFWMGLLSGISFYILFLALPAIAVFALPRVFTAQKERLKKNFLFFFGALIGILPLIIYNLSTKGGTLFRAAGRSLSVGRESLHTPLAGLVLEIIQQKTYYLLAWIKSAPLLFATYIVPEQSKPMLQSLFGLLLILLMIVFVIIAFSDAIKDQKQRCFMRGFAWYCIALIVFGWCANFTRPRHLLPLLTMIPPALLSLRYLRPSFKFAGLALIFIAAGQLTGWAKPCKTPPFNPYPVAEFLKRESIGEFYGSYKVTYSIVFATGEKIVGTPFLLSEGDIISDRRAAYTRRVNASAKPAFIFDDGQKQLFAEFTTFLAAHDLRSKFALVGNACIAYDVSGPVKPVIAGLTKTVFTE